jgi:hypothetical protein
MLIGPYFPRKLAFCFCPSPPHFCLAHPRRSTIRIDPWPSLDAFESGAMRDSGHQPAIPKLESSSKQLGESQSSHLIRCRPPHYPVLAEQTTFPPVIFPHADHQPSQKGQGQRSCLPAGLAK